MVAARATAWWFLHAGGSIDEIKAQFDGGGGGGGGGSGENVGKQGAMVRTGSLKQHAREMLIVVLIIHEKRGSFRFNLLARQQQPALVVNITSLN